jgi:serine/threonine protein kinase
MTTPSSEPMRAAPLTPEAAEELAAKLIEEMGRRWRQGERLLAEDFLARHPQLWEHPAAAADLIYEELCLRQEYGPEVPVEQVLRRFPQWRPQLEVLFDCQQILGPRRAAPQFPAVGEFLGDFLLLAELGGGAEGRVFLASQLSLGDRPVVLKLTAIHALTACQAHEHLALARLQHTHIVPLYSVQDYPARGLRALCMPYFGGATLAQLLDALRAQPPARRTGQSLLDALDQAQAATLPLSLPAPLHGDDGKLRSGPARRGLAGASYVQAICWMAACLADALQYAHERGLVHLDLKPSNVLLAADGQPMLLDFHLAREPIHPGGHEPTWLGGTIGYVSPEQQAALLAIQQGRKVPQRVDGRSDIYSLGIVIYEALTGTLPGTVPAPRATATEGRRIGVRELRRCNPQVSAGLADIIGKCLAPDPSDRYPTMAALAADLRRHLAHLPLVGVRNRSLGERWRKWRYRRPYGLAFAGIILAILTAAAAVTVGAADHFLRQTRQARTALDAGQQQLDRGEWDGAIATLQQGLRVARSIPLEHDLADRLEQQLQRAEQARTAAHRGTAVRELHQLAERIRSLRGANYVPPEESQGLEASCRAFWENRNRIVARLSSGGAAALDPAVRDDLVALAIFWADLQVRLAPPAGQEEARRQALAVLAEAAALFGPSPALDAQRRRLALSER